MKIVRTYKYKLRPNKKQVALLGNTLDICRYLYNCALQERRDAYSKQRISLDYYDQQNELPECRKVNDELRGVNAQVLQDALRRLDKAFQGFFRRVKAKQNKILGIHDLKVVIDITVLRIHSFLMVVLKYRMVN